MKHLAIFISVLFGQWLTAQNTDQKVILITMDGYRWQELFTGADEGLISNGDFKGSGGLKTQFWANTAEERRKTLMPFVWGFIAKEGQIHGNRALGSKVNLTNGMWFSYPGYNEILTGRADDKRIDHNDKINNPNTTVLELLNSTAEFKGKVFAFGGWDLYPYIINEDRSGVPVNAGFSLAEGGDLSEKERFLNEIQPQVPSPFGTVRFDAFTHHYALETMKKHHPNMVYIAYNQTDDFAHMGDYSAYLKSAQVTDSFLKDLWEFTQNDPFYKDRTTFIIATDHGRGTQPLANWKDHGAKVEGADQVWLMAFGNQVKAQGEAAQNGQLYNNQIAPTILKWFGLEKLGKELPADAIDFSSPK